METLQLPDTQITERSMPEAVRIFAPATVANVAAGCDILGSALTRPGDELLVRKTDQPGIYLINETSLSQMPLDPASNTAGVALQAYLDHVGTQYGFQITFRHKIKPGSGIGSSAASAAGAVYGANYLLGEPLPRKELVRFAMEGERTASGSAHADNVAPALLGGFVLVRSYHPLDIVTIQAPPRLFCSILHPQIELKTEDARKVLKKNITLKDAVVQWGNVAGLIAGLLQEDYELIGRSLQDVIVEPVRSLLIPGYDRIKEAALRAGALGCSISGSGPSLFALSTSEDAARKIGQAMQSGCAECGMEAEMYVSAINSQGAVVLG